MTNAEMTLDYLIRHRGELIAETELNRMAEENDREIVEETLCHIWVGYYDAEPVAEITINRVRKDNNKIRRDRKIAENRKHYEKLCAKRMNMEGV